MSPQLAECIAALPEGHWKPDQPEVDAIREWAEGSTVWVLIRRLNSSWSRSIALVVRALFHWLTGNRVKVNSRSPASSRLSATALHLSRHLRMKVRRRASISAAEVA